jgi:hypothetical protein
VPRHIARLVTRLVVPLVVDYSASRRLVVDYSASRRLVVNYSASRRLVVDYSPPPRVRVPRHVAPLVVDHSASRGSSCGSLRRSSSTTSPPPRVRVPRHVTRLVTRIVARLVVDYFSYAARLVPRHVARPIACRRLLCLRRAAGCLGTSRSSSRGSLRRSSSTTSPTPRVRVPRHVARPVTRLIVDYSVRRDFILRPRWLYFSHAMRRGYLSCGNTGSTSSTPCAATTSSSGRIALTIHLDKFSKLVENGSHAPNN